MQLGGKSPKQSDNLFGEDFASGFEESKFDKFKPALKVLGAIVLLAGLGIGSLYYFGNKSDDSSSFYGQADMSDDAKIIDEALSKKAELSQKFSACTSKASDEGSDLSTADPDFNKKLISSYDNWLACHDQYPEAAVNASPSRSSLELARQGAIDSSGSYKDTYLSSNSYDYTPSTYTPTYRPSDYSSSGDSSTASPPPTYTEPPSNKKDEAWCSSKKAEVNSLYSQYQTARDAVSTLDTKIFNVAENVRQRAGGLNESQVQNMIANERNKLQAQRPNLVTQQNSAQSQYNSAQGEYSRNCY